MVREPERVRRDITLASRWFRGIALVTVLIGSACGAPSATPTVDADAFAGEWRETPLKANDEVVAGIERLCREAFGTAEFHPRADPAHVASAPVALADARGSAIVHALFGTASAGGLCWNGEVTDGGLVRRADEALLLLTWSQLPEPNRDEACPLAVIRQWVPPEPTVVTPDRVPPFSAVSVAGRAGSDVASVSIEVADVGEVTPTFEDGIFLAWWPGQHDDFTVIGRDEAGEPIAEWEPDSEDGTCSF
jgi:hypothetical protein